MALMAPDGTIYAITQRPRQLVRITRRATRLTVTAYTLPPSLLSPAALALDAGDLLVLDLGSRSVHRLRGQAPLRDVGSFAVADATEMCAMHGRVYVYRRRDGSPVSVYSATGRLVASFGRQFGSGSAARRESISQVSLLCDAESNSVIVAARLTGEVRAYAATGRELWAKVVPGIRGVIFKEWGERGVTLTSAPGGSHELIALGNPETGTFLAQYGIQGRPGWVLTSEPARRRVVLSHLLHPEN